jgi:hypothetical protein
VHYEAGSIEHSGGVGAGCILLYIPTAKTYVFLATNIGMLLEGKLAAEANH